MKILIADTSYPINSRNLKIADSLAKAFTEDAVEIVCWNRDNSDFKPYRYRTYCYDKFSPLGKLAKKFLNLKGYGKFLSGVIREGNYDVVIASHWEVLFLASRCKQKGSRLIYENLDIPTAGRTFMRRFMEWLEGIGLRKTDAIVHASRFFQPLYASSPAAQFLLENKPVTEQHPLPGKPAAEGVRLRVAFLGNLRYENIMRNLIDAVRGLEGVELTLHGRGGILGSLKEYASGLSNVTFTGGYSQADLPEIYSGADVIWAAYPNDDYNVRYAISNKFFECTTFGVPGIYSDRTLLGDYVVSHHTGWDVDPFSREAIRDLFVQIRDNRSEIDERKAALSEEKKSATSWEHDIRELIAYIANN